MTKLEKLYSAIENLKELGLSLPEEYLTQVNEYEQELIRDEIVPVIKAQIEPVIRQIRREIVLVVDYVPDAPLSVRISRKRHLSEFSDAIEIQSPEPQEQPVIELEIEAEEEPQKRKYSPKSSKTNLCVSLPDGRIIKNRFAYQTLLDVIRYAGIEQVSALNLYQNGILLIDTKQDNFYNQVEISKGIYVITHSSTSAKKSLIERISNELNLHLKVDIE